MAEHCANDDKSIMTVFFDILAALDQQLNLMPSLPPVAWQNKTYEPVLGTLFLRPTILPADVEVATTGDIESTDINAGIYQVDVFAEANSGKNEAMVMADLIADQFKRGTKSVYNSVTVEVTSVSMSATNENDGWYQIPINIQYQSYTAAR